MFSIQRRLVHLTIARAEWEQIIDELDRLEELAQLCQPSLDALRVRLSGETAKPEQMVTFSQPPLDWSPFIFALSTHVLKEPTLLTLAQRLRDQMFRQSKVGEGPIPQEHMSQMLTWPASPPDDPSLHAFSGN